MKAVWNQNTSQKNGVYHELMHYGTKKIALKTLTRTEISQLDPLCLKY